MVDVVACPEQRTNLDDGMFVEFGAIDKIEIVVHDGAVSSCQTADGSGIVKQQVAVDIVESVDSIAWVQLGEGIDIAVSIREAHKSRCMDTVAKEESLVHADMLFVNRISHDDTLVGAYLRHILRAHLHDGFAVEVKEPVYILVLLLRSRL